MTHPTDRLLLALRDAARAELGALDNHCLALAIVAQRAARDFLGIDAQLVNDAAHAWLETAGGRVIDVQAGIFLGARPAHWRPIAGPYADALRRDAWGHLTELPRTPRAPAVAARILDRVLRHVAERGSWGQVAAALTSPRAANYAPALADAVRGRAELADLRPLVESLLPPAERRPLVEALRGTAAPAPRRTWLFLT